MTRLRVAFAGALLGALMGCDIIGGGTRRTLTIEHYQVECVGVALGLCLLIKGPDDPVFTRHYGGIEGFEYQWGFVYRIEVEEHDVSPVEADGSSIRTEFRRLLGRERVPQGTQFDLILTAGEGRVVEVAPDRYRFYGTAEFVCAPGGACSDLRAQITAGARIQYTLQHPAAAEDPLTLVQWQVCASGDLGGPCTS